MFPIRPNEDRVIVKPQELSDKTETGFWIPDSAKGKRRRGKVVAVGIGKTCPNCHLPHPPEIKEGMDVSFPETAGFEEMIGGEPYIILRAGDIQLYDPNSVPS